MTRKNIMKTAHKIAKQIVNRTNDYMVALKLALKYVWFAVKNWNKKRFTWNNIQAAINYICTPKSFRESDKYVDGVPTWLINENLNQQESYAVRNECDGINIERETEKAVLVKFNTVYGFITMWAPKSVCNF